MEIGLVVRHPEPDRTQVGVGVGRAHQVVLGRRSQRSRVGRLGGELKEREKMTRDVRRQQRSSFHETAKYFFFNFEMLLQAVEGEISPRAMEFNLRS